MNKDKATFRKAIRIGFLCEAALGFLAVGLGKLWSCPPAATWSWNAFDAATGALAAVPLWVGLLLMTRYPVGPLKRLDALIREHVVPMFAAGTIVEMLAISLAAGVGEELLFRGLIQAMVARTAGSLWVGVCVASALFGLAHALTATYAVLATLIGAYLSWLWWVSGNLLTPVVTHALYDFGALVYLVRLRDATRHRDLAS